MSHSVSRRQFLHGLGIVAAAAALSACSSTNKAISEAIIDGAVGGVVITDGKLTYGTKKNYSSDNVLYYYGLELTMKNVSSRPVTVGLDNFNTTLDGIPVSVSEFFITESKSSDGASGHGYTTTNPVTIKPGEECIIEPSYFVSQLVHDNWYKDNHTVSVTFTCGGQRVTYTGTSRSNKVTVSEIENV